MYFCIKEKKKDQMYCMWNKMEGQEVCESTEKRNSVQSSVQFRQLGRNLRAQEETRKEMVKREATQSWYVQTGDNSDFRQMDVRGGKITNLQWWGEMHRVLNQSNTWPEEKTLFFRLSWIQNCKFTPPPSSTMAPCGITYISLYVCLCTSTSHDPFNIPWHIKP